MSEQEPFSGWAIALIPIGFFIIFPIFWCFVVWLISLLSGWQGLAQRYRARQPVAGKRWEWQYGMVSWAGYNGVLNLTANQEGLLMEVMFLFRIGHDPLFIPWHEFHHAKISYFLWRRQVRAQVGFPSVATIRLPAAVFEESEGRKLLESQNRV